MPVSKTDAHAGTFRGRYKALRRYFRDRKAAKRGREIIEDDLRRERIGEFVRRAKFGTGNPAGMEKLLDGGIERGKLSSFSGYSR